MILMQSMHMCFSRTKRNSLGRALAAFSCLFIGLLIASAPIIHAEASTASDGRMLTADHYALSGFKSHLPVLVLATGENGGPSEEDGYFIDASLFSYEGLSDNAPSGRPAISTAVTLRNLSDGKLGVSERKDDYLLRLEKTVSLAGLNESNEYLLLGAKGDKSLIRNYIGYALAAEVVEDAPGLQLCEVFLRGDSGDLYQGVYSLVALTTHEDGVIFQRGLKGGGIPVETYSARNDPESGEIYLPILETAKWDDRYAQSVAGLDAAENVLYSTQSRVFYTTPKYFDIASFTDLFILSEIMGNYAEMYGTYYEYDTETGMVTAALIWNFEYALDNQPDEPMVIGQLGYDSAPYFDQFFKSAQFADQIKGKYLDLRMDALCEDNLMRLVKEGAAAVAPAVDRDWARFNQYRHVVLAPLQEIEMDDETTERVYPYDRQTKTYDEELLKISHVLREHNLHTAINITRFDFSEQEVHKEIVINSNPVWLTLAIIGFFFVVQFVRRYGM